MRAATLPSTQVRPLPLTDPSRRTRGKSRPGRLRLLAPLFRAELRGATGVAVDLGLGAMPWTTLEWSPTGMSVVAVDVDPERVAQARTAGLDARVGGFDLPVHGARIVRCMNVLRQYRPETHDDARTLVGRHLCEGGALVEGRTDKPGCVVVATLWRRRQDHLWAEAAWIGTDFRHGFAPMMFRAIAPPQLQPLLGAWQQRWGEGRRLAPEAAFARSAPGDVVAPGVCAVPLSQQAPPFGPGLPLGTSPRSRLDG